MMQSVQVIIERLKSHPEEFFGDLDDGRPQHVKFGELASKIDDLLTEKQDGHIHRLWYLTEDEKVALIDAYREARRARFEAKVFHTLLTAQEPEERSTVTYRTQGRYHPHTGKELMEGSSSIITPASMMNQAQQILDQEFQKQYAENRNT